MEQCIVAFSLKSCRWSCREEIFFGILLTSNFGGGGGPDHIRKSSWFWSTEELCTIHVLWTALHSNLPKLEVSLGRGTCFIPIMECVDDNVVL